MYPLEVYHPDDPTRLCRPKAGQSLVIQIREEMRLRQYSDSLQRHSCDLSNFYCLILGTKQRMQKMEKKTKQVSVTEIWNAMKKGCLKLQQESFMSRCPTIGQAQKEENWFPRTDVDFKEILRQK